MRISISILCFAVIFFFSCTKKNDSSGSHPKDQTTDTINFVGTQVHDFSAGYDTTDNYVTSYDFERKRLSLDGGSYVGDSIYTTYVKVDSAYAHYHVRYVGGVPLVDPSLVRKRHGAIDVFMVNKSLLGKPLFEIYDMKTDKLVKRYVCASDSASAGIDYSVWDNLTITPKQTGDALNYYVTVKQTDALTYY